MHGTGQELHTNYNQVKILTKKGPWSKAECSIYLPFLSKVDKVLFNKAPIQPHKY